jgi:signal transduction histidine kinase
MNSARIWLQWRCLLERWRRMSELPAPEREVFFKRVRIVERSLMLPVKGLVLVTLAWFLFGSSSFDRQPPPLDDTAEYLRRFFLAYAALSIGAGIIVLGMDEVSSRVLERVVYSVAVIDAVMLAGMTLLTEGWDSPLYWLFIALIFRNTATIPHADVQVLVNLITTGLFATAGLLQQAAGPLTEGVIESTNPSVRHPIRLSEHPPALESIILRILLLLLTTACCYAIQVIVDRQRRQDEEATELQSRKDQLEAAGRLAAQIAHQLKNPLGIINNAAYTLQRTVREGKTITQQISIIREEVERSDRIITELMGYARLAEGRIEKIRVVDELERAISEALPQGAAFEVAVHRSYAAVIPDLLGQRAHISEIFLNLITNAREAMNGKGDLFITAESGEDYSAVVTVWDSGPGIRPEDLGRIFEPYFTTKAKGTGLGLAIVKHNAEIYGGSVAVESMLGKGATFTVSLPARSSMRVFR